MEEQKPGICVMPLGGKPRVITLMLDALRHHGECFDEVIVVHLEVSKGRYRESLTRLTSEFAQDQYQGQHCHFRPQLISFHGRPVAALHHEDDLDAVSLAFDKIFGEIKGYQRQIHLCLSGGPRLLALYAAMQAQKHFLPTDRIWHIHSSDEVKDRLEQKDALHADQPDDVTLLRVRMPGLNGVYQHSRLTSERRQQCEAVCQAISDRQLEVLQAIVNGDSDQVISERLKIEVATVANHKTRIFDTCVRFFPDARRSVQWIRATFSDYFL